MLRSVAAKSLRDQRRSLVGWTLGLVLLVGMYVGIYPSVHGNTSYTDLINKLPESFRAMFVAGGGDLSSGPGYLYVELLSFMAPLLVLIYAVGSGAGTIAGEQDRRTFDLLLAAPVSRTRVLLEKSAAIGVGLLLLMAVVWVSVTGLGAAAHMGLSPGRVAATCVHLGLLGVVFGALAVFVGAATGRLGAARVVPAMVAVVGYLINGFAPTVQWLRPIRPASPFYQYLGHDPIRHGLSFTSVAVSVATAAVLVALAVVTFRRRDIT